MVLHQLDEEEIVAVLKRGNMPTMFSYRHAFRLGFEYARSEEESQMPNKEEDKEKVRAMLRGLMDGVGAWVDQHDPEVQALCDVIEAANLSTADVASILGEEIARMTTLLNQKLEKVGRDAAKAARTRFLNTLAQQREQSYSYLEDEVNVTGLTPDHLVIACEYERSRAEFTLTRKTAGRLQQLLNWADEHTSFKWRPVRVPGPTIRPVPVTPRVLVLDLTFDVHLDTIGNQRFDNILLGISNALSAAFSRKVADTEITIRDVHLVLYYEKGKLCFDCALTGDYATLATPALAQKAGLPLTET
jgi:hypothetical protein